SFAGPATASAKRRSAPSVASIARNVARRLRRMARAARDVSGTRDAVASMLHAHAQRLTPTRQRIVGVLADASGPLTIPEILAAGRGLAQSSVYRNLVVLEEAGVVHRVVPTYHFARYEADRD